MLTYLDLFETESGEADGWIVMLNRRLGACLCRLHCSNKVHVCHGDVQQLKVAWLLLSFETDLSFSISALLFIALYLCV